MGAPAPRQLAYGVSRMRHKTSWVRGEINRQARGCFKGVPRARSPGRQPRIDRRTALEVDPLVGRPDPQW
jgi:hypothetical protein